MRFLLPVLLTGALLLAPGCQSPPHAAAPDAVAAIEVMNTSELDCAMAIRKTFLRAGYTAKPNVDTRMFVYEKTAGQMDEFMYGGWGLAPVKIRVKVSLVGLAAGHYVIAANPYTIRDGDDIRLEDEKKTYRHRKDYQAMLEMIRDELLMAASPSAPPARP